MRRYALRGILAHKRRLLSTVTVPLAIVWGVLGVWLGRAQHRRVSESSAQAERSVRREEPVVV